MSILPVFSDERRLVTQIAEAIAWCAPRADVAAAATCLRSRELAPPALAYPDHAVASVATSRGFGLQRAHVPVSRGAGLAGGRLLAFAIDDCLTEGAVGLATNGYFDDEDIPPWDTWIAFIDEREFARGRYLVSWVPPQFVEVVGAAFDVCSTDFLSWVDETDTAFRKMLRRLNAI